MLRVWIDLEGENKQSFVVTSNWKRTILFSDLIIEVEDAVCPLIIYRFRFLSLVY